MKNLSTKSLALLGILTATVVILQYLGSFIRFGTFSISLVLIPIVVGAALISPLGGAWLGFVFSIIVLFTDSAVFMAISPIGTIITVIVKGTLAGYLAGLVYQLLKDKNQTIAVVVAAIVCPVVNTGIFLIGCRLFFFDFIKELAGGSNVYTLMIVGLVGVNFLLELVVNIILSPTIVRLINYADNRYKHF